MTHRQLVYKRLRAAVVSPAVPLHLNLPINQMHRLQAAGVVVPATLLLSHTPVVQQPGTQCNTASSCVGFSVLNGQSASIEAGPALLVDVPPDSNITADVMRELAIPPGTLRVLFRTSNTAKCDCCLTTSSFSCQIPDRGLDESWSLTHSCCS